MSMTEYGILDLCQPRARNHRVHYSQFKMPMTSVAQPGNNRKRVILPFLERLFNKLHARMICIVYLRSIIFASFNCLLINKEPIVEVTEIKYFYCEYNI